ncbi:EscU/YscU/HrcU family type III secretion system export apparatus switch protein, partial [Acinetobacter baumannii]
MAPFLLAIAIAGIAAAAVQNPITFRTKRIAPDLSRLSLAKGLGRLFGMQSLIVLAKTTAKLVLITTVVSLLVRRSFQ